MRLSIGFAVLAISLLGGSVLLAQSSNASNDGRQEFGITVGELSSGSPSIPGGGLNLDSGVAVAANFARKIREMGGASLYWEIEGMGGPLRYLSGTPGAATHEIHSLYLTPGVKLQFMPKEVLSPWLAAGGGYAMYDSSNTAIAGGPASGGLRHTYAVDFGGGMDYAFGKRYVVRAEARGFYTGNPNYGTPSTNGLFNFVIGGGLVWRFK